MIKIIFGTVLALAVLFGAIAGTMGYIEKLQSELKTAEAKIISLQEQQELSRKTEAKVLAARQVEHEKAEERAKLMENVLCDNADWSAVMVPDDVVRLLEQGYNFNSSCIPAPGDAAGRLQAPLP